MCLLGSWIFPATALAPITMGEIVWLSSSEAAFTISLNLGSSEFSTSRFATNRIRFALRAMLVAPATSIWGWWLAMATRHLSKSFLMASSDASSRDLVSMASSTRPIHISILWMRKHGHLQPRCIHISNNPHLSFSLHCQSTDFSWSQNVHMQLDCLDFSAEYEQQIPPKKTAQLLLSYNICWKQGWGNRKYLYSMTGEAYKRIETINRDILVVLSLLLTWQQPGFPPPCSCWQCRQLQPSLLWRRACWRGSQSWRPFPQRPTHDQIKQLSKRLVKNKTTLFPISITPPIEA